MRNAARPLAGVARAVVFVVLAAAMAAPAAAQFGGLKKKVKSAAGVQETSDQAAPAAAGAEGGGTLVLSDDVVNRLIAGLRAGKEYREAAAKDNSKPYGQYLEANAGYKAAKAKCDAAAQTYPQRISADQKLAAKSQAFLEKMMAAQQKQDTALQRAYGDSLLYLQDPSCTVKQPRQPDNWFDLQREVDTGAEQQEQKASDLDGRELGTAKDRAVAIIQDAPPPDVSASEKDAVKKREAELKRLMGMEEVPAARDQKPAPPAAAAPAPQPVTPTVSPDQSAMAECMGKNAEKHKKEMERLAAKLQASEGGDMQTTLAIADSIRQLQMAGCEGK